MKRQIVRRIVRSVGVTLTVLMITGVAPAQFVVGAKAGIVLCTQGNVFLDGEQLRLPYGSYLQMGEGQKLHTVQGRVELLLNPSGYLRMAEDGLLRMEHNLLTDIQLALEQGSALIEIVQEIKGSRIRVRLPESLVEISKAGLYRLDAGCGELRVYSGVASAACGSRKITVKKDRMVRLGDLASKPAKFNANAADSLHRWAAQRSFELFIANSSTRKQTHWTPIALGWLRNASYRMKFYSQLAFDEWILEQQIRQRQAAIQAAQAQTSQEQAVQAQAVQSQAAQAWAQAQAQGTQAKAAEQATTPAPQPSK
jgi:hypothetical protein